MKFGKTFLFAMALCALMVAALPAAAADLNGTWLVKFEGPRGPQEQTYTFKVDGAKLTGKLTTQRGDVELKDGKVDGDMFEFSVERPGRGDNPATTAKYKGKVSGDSITLSTEMGGQAREMKGERKK